MLTVLAIWFIWYVVAPLAFIGLLVAIYLTITLGIISLEKLKTKKRVIRAEKSKTDKQGVAGRDISS